MGTGRNQPITEEKIMSSVVDSRYLSLTRISIRILDPGSKRYRIPDPDQQKRF
jgi:hypothetical protein